MSKELHKKDKGTKEERKVVNPTPPGYVPNVPGFASANYVEIEFGSLWGWDDEAINQIWDKDERIEE